MVKAILLFLLEKTSGQFNGCNLIRITLAFVLQELTWTSTDATFGLFSWRCTEQCVSPKVISYRVCHGFRLTKQYDYMFLSRFWPLLDWALFLEAAGTVYSVNWLKSKSKPPSENLACPNPWNTLYQIEINNIFYLFIMKLFDSMKQYSHNSVAKPS